jgi:hypothetical protein
MTDAPKRIWLVTTPGAYVEDDVYRHGLEPGAVEYVRADLVTDAPEASPRQEREALAEIIRRHIEAAWEVPEKRAGWCAEDIIDAGYVPPEAHAAALREAWEAGRDAAAREADGVAADYPDGAAGVHVALRALARQSANIAKRCAERIRALTPPAPKGDDR